MSMRRFTFVVLLLAAVSCHAYTASKRSSHGLETIAEKSSSTDRRSFLQQATVAASTAIFGSQVALLPSAVWASGGATAGKYTTIPIAKRRYYGRVQEAVHEFLLMGPAMIAADTTSNDVQHFFDVKGTVIVEAKRKDVNGQCTKKDGDCRGKEIRDSRYNDMKASMYLLGNAFRFNQQKAPDNLPTVQAAKRFFKDMDKLEKLAVKSPKAKDKSAQALFLSALDTLDQYLDLVELPPTDSGHYDKEFDTKVGETSRIT
mmetsp:Transcript_51266/g.76593  ORF Transcript_51266/g.76593 Transcript_51266/m.76593 type:complete len:259 (-) Transcript_51266:2440-3216(-)